MSAETSNSLPDPRPCSIATDNKLGLDRLLLSLLPCWLDVGIRLLVCEQIGAEESVGDCADLSWSCFLLGEMSKSDSDGVGGEVGY